MAFVRTTQATNRPRGTPLVTRLLRALLFFIPQPDHGYRNKMHLIREWWVECGSSGDPWREIAFDASGEPVYAGPDDRTYGFWCDTNMTLTDFEGPEVDEAEFEAMWARTAHMREGEVESAATLEHLGGDPRA